MIANLSGHWKLLKKKKADTIGASYIVDLKRAARMDYTSGIAWTEPYNLVVPKPEFQSRLFAFVFPFQQPVKCLNEFKHEYYIYEI